MKKNNLYKLAAALLSVIVLLTACEKEVKINLPYEGNKIVLNSLIFSDSLIYARVTNSSELSNTRNFPVPAGAKIDLYENDVFRQTMGTINIYGNSWFVSSFRSVRGRKYTLKASATGLADAEGSDIIPAKPSLRGESYRIINSNGSEKAKVVIRINDPVGEKNYYRLRVYAADTNYISTGPRILVDKSGTEYFRVDKLVSNAAFDIFGDNEYRQIYFTDDQFNGNEISLTIELGYYPSSHLYIAPELTAITRDAYRYLQSRENYSINDGNPFTEAIITYNNISGGYGIVGGLSDSLVLIRKQ
ncbi:MAG: DUF4249 domain-containing protein [Sphingobacteriales bacterium]|nr:DUF4249 domain-containing protein [Sphingobacteriales bacterium]